jgi:subtilase family serine protease
LTLGVAITLSGMIAAIAAAGIASAATSSPESAVPQGPNPATYSSSTQTGATAPSTPITVSFILKERNEQALASAVEHGWRGPYLSTAQFAQSYGQPSQVISELQSYLRSYRISSSAYSDGLVVTATGTAEEFERALSVTMDNYNVREGHGRYQHVYASKRNPSLPSHLSADILAVLGLTNYSPYSSHAVKANGEPAGRKEKEKTEAIPAGELTPQFFVERYGLSSVESSGAIGQGQTLGVVTLASLEPRVAERFWQIVGLRTASRRIHLENVDGGSGPVSLELGSEETTLDVEQSGAIAPQSQIVVYQAPNTSYGFADAFFTAASQNAAGSVSTSWGESETAILVDEHNGTYPASYAEVFNEAFLEMGAQGQSSFAASGDEGAFDAVVEPGTTNLTVDNPADSPYVTASGGTTLSGTQTYAITNGEGEETGATESVTIPTEMTWSWDYLWPLYSALGLSSEEEAANSAIGGSGGGYSVIEGEPSYQQSVRGVSQYDDVNYLTPTDYNDSLGLELPFEFAFNPHPRVSSGSANGGRAMPDLAFDADPQTGYAVYDPQFEESYGSEILQFGGTSFIGPQLNGTTAVLESSLGHRIGFWNPVIYGAAQSSRSPFVALDENQIYGSSYFSQTNAHGRKLPLSGSFSNNNLYYTGSAGSTFNPGSGLGPANLGALRQFFAEA